MVTFDKSGFVVVENACIGEETNITVPTTLSVVVVVGAQLKNSEFEIISNQIAFLFLLSRYIFVKTLVTYHIRFFLCL
jgi:hypothetical protein